MMSNETSYSSQYEGTTAEQETKSVDMYEGADQRHGFNYYDYEYGDDGYSYSHNYLNGSYPAYEHTIFLYQGFAFERPIYQFIWEILVVLTTLFNIVVIAVLLRKKMRNVIHTVLVAIAISDSMTGLVTLPTYIYTYSHYEPGHETGKAIYVLDKYWCNAFMISKFFLSKWFHTVSIWLTLFLGTQRFVSVLFPFKAQRMFTMKNTLIFITVIFVLSPFLHIYHLIHIKADVHFGLCHWRLEDKWVLVQLWATLLLMHLIPSILLVVLTVMVICRLFSAVSQLTKTEGTSASMADRRHDWNRRMSVIVSTIVIAFLIPEVPYAIFLLITLVHSHSGKNIMPLNVNRVFHAVYEILLILSFHTNFWIYTVLNRRFRSELKKTASEIQNCILRLSGKPVKKISITSTSMTGGKTVESSLSGRTGIKLKGIGASSTSDSKSEGNPLNDTSADQKEKDEKV